MNQMISNIYNYSNKATVEFDRFFNIKAEATNKYVWSVKPKKVLNEVDRYYFVLPKLASAIAKKCSLAIENGIEIDDENKDTDTNRAIVKEFEESFDLFQHFFDDVARIDSTKGTQAIIYLRDSKKFTTIETDRLCLVTPSKNGINVKNNITHIRISDDSALGYTEFKFDDVNIILFRNTPSSVFAIPPLMFNQSMSQEIIAEIQRAVLSNAEAGYDKTLLMPATNGDNIERLDAKSLKRIQTHLDTITKVAGNSISVTDKRLDKIMIESIQMNPQFWNNYLSGFMHHISALSGVPSSFLVPSSEVNRSTKESDYEEMIKSTVKPLNTRLSKLLMQMFTIWYADNKDGMPPFSITIKNAPEKINIQLSAKELLVAEKHKIILTNELRSLMGLREYTDEELQERERVRALMPSNKNNTI